MMLWISRARFKKYSTPITTDAEMIAVIKDIRNKYFFIVVSLEDW